MTIRGRFLGLLAIVALAGLSFSGALAQDATPVASPVASPVAATDCGTLLGIGTPDDGCLIFINGVAGDQALDLYINGFEAVDSLGFDDVSGYFALPAGSYSFDLVPAGQSLDAALVSLADYSVNAGEALEVAVVGTADSPRFIFSAPDLSPLPPAEGGMPVGNTRIRAINAAAGAPPVDVAIIGGDIAERLATGLEFQDVSAYLTKIAGTYRLQFSSSEGDIVTLVQQEAQFAEETVNSVYLIGDTDTDDVRLLTVSVDLANGASTARAVPPALVSDIVTVSSFAIYEGNCDQPSGQVAYELSGTGYDATGPGTLAPWGADADPQGALGAVPVLYGEGELADLNLGNLLGGRTVSVVVRDAATGGVVACGAVGGVIEKADHFWQHDRLVVGLEPVGDSGISGTATFTEDTGILNDKINVSVSLVTSAE